MSVEEIKLLIISIAPAVSAIAGIVGLFGKFRSSSGKIEKQAIKIAELSNQLVSKQDDIKALSYQVTQLSNKVDKLCEK